MSVKLGKLVKDARAAKGMTQAALAEQAGITASEVGKIERGEKEPSQAVLKLMAKALGVTQKSLLEAASGTGAASGNKASGAGKTASSAKTGKASSGTGKTSSGSGKTTSGSGKASSGTGKTASGSGKASSGTGKASAKTGKASSKADADIGALTASEKKLVRLYRKADSGTKKAAVQLLSGEGSPLEILGSMFMGKKEVSSMASGLFESLLSGKGGASAGLTRGPVEDMENTDQMDLKEMTPEGADPADTEGI